SHQRVRCRSAPDRSGAAEAGALDRAAPGRAARTRVLVHRGSARSGGRRGPLPARLGPSQPRAVAVSPGGRTAPAMAALPARESRFPLAGRQAASPTMVSDRGGIVTHDGRPLIAMVRPEVEDVEELAGTLAGILRSGRLTNGGPVLAEFEAALARYLGAED